MNTRTKYISLVNTLLGCSMLFLLVENVCNAQWRQSIMIVNNGDYGAFLAFVDQFGQDVLLAGYESGLRKSVDGGQSWERIDDGIEGKISCLTRKGDTLYAGGVASGIYESVDDGNSWKRLNSNLRNDSISCLIVYRNRIYAGTRSKGVYVTEDGAQIWKSISSGLIGSHIADFEIFNDSLFTAIQDPGGIYCLDSVANGWQSVSFPGRPYFIWSMLLTDSTWYIGVGGSFGGIYTSTDRGSHWEYSTKDLSVSLCHEFLILEHSVFAAVNAFPNPGVIMSDDDGASWRVVSHGLPSLSVHAIYAGRENIVAMTNVGFFYRPISEVLTSVIEDEFVPIDNPVSIALLPQPVVNSCNIRIVAERSSMIMIALYDRLGIKRLENGLVDVLTGNNHYTIDLSAIPAGVYYIVISSDDIYQVAPCLIRR